MQLRFGTGFYGFLDGEPELAAHYNAVISMAGLGTAIAAAYDFSGVRSVADIGGGWFLVLFFVPALAEMSVATLAGLMAAAPAVWLSRGYPETRLLWVAVAFFAVAVLVCAIVEIGRAHV